MPKWTNKQRVISMVKQKNSEQREFYELFVLVVRCFRLFGLCPINISYVKDRPKIESNRWLKVIAILIIILIWAALIGSFFVQYNTPLITGIANHIQFIANVVAVSITLGVPIFKCYELNGILEDFIEIDKQMTYYKMNMNNSQLKTSFGRCFIAHVFFLFISSLYDAYVMLIQEQDTKFWLWFCHLIPFTLYSLAFMMAFTMIKWIKVRIQQLNRLIEQQQRFQHSSMDKIEKGTKISSVVSMKGENEEPNVVENSEELNITNGILPIASKMIDLATRLESYYGLLFLFGYLALFCVTTIQVYYCYLYVTVGSLDGDFAINSFGLSLVIILGNLMAILALPYICEEVGNESKTLMSYLSKLSMKHGQNTNSSIWFPSLLSSIKFSAMGFFDISYNMLSGFLAGLITYLIIFIQFSSVAPMKAGLRLYTRSMNGKYSDLSYSATK